MKLSLKQKGQASIEYILMFAVVISVGLAVLTNIREYLLSSNNGALTQMIRSFDNVFGGEGGGNFAFKRFNLRR